MPKPSVGRTVHYCAARVLNASDEHEPCFVPAVVTKVWTDGSVNLRIFHDGPVPVGFRSAVKEGEGVGQWRWPPRE